MPRKARPSGEAVPIPITISELNITIRPAAKAFFITLLGKCCGGIIAEFALCLEGVTENRAHESHARGADPREGRTRKLRLDDVPLPEPGAGEARVALRFAGVNFIDVYLRSGLYDPGPLPAALGREGMGVVDAVGPESSISRPATASPSATPARLRRFAVVPAARLLRVPERLADADARRCRCRG